MVDGHEGNSVEDVPVGVTEATSNQTDSAVTLLTSGSAGFSLASLFEELEPGLPPAEVNSLLQQARTRLRSLDPETAVNKVQSFLASGDDLETGLPFRVGEGGLLVTSPAMRVFAMDVLFELDPKKSSEIAREILDRSNSPDEWAVGLRNFARGAESGYRQIPEDVARDLNAYALRYFSNSEWMENPTAGYLNGFDLLAYSGEVPLLKQAVKFAGRSSQINNALAVSLSKVASEFPLAAVATVPNLRSSRFSPRFTGQLYCHLDPSIQEERVSIENYINAPSTNDEEVIGFLSVFPTIPMVQNYGLYDLVTNGKNPTVSLSRYEAAADVIESLRRTSHLSDAVNVELEQAVVRIESLKLELQQN